MPPSPHGRVRVARVSRDVPLERLGPLGCNIQTGAGAVMNALNVRPGTRFASFGVGAVGCSAIMAARAVGATTIVATDIVPSRLEMAKELGATHANHGGRGYEDYGKDVFERGRTKFAESAADFRAIAEQHRAEPMPDAMGPMESDEVVGRITLFAGPVALVPVLTALD